MRRARAGPAPGLARIVVALAAAVLRQDRRRAVEIAELDVEVGRERLEVLGAEIGGGARDVARVGLLDRELADRPALRARRSRAVSGPAIPLSTSASFQARLCASWMPVLPPKPPFGGIRCAASPARKTRPSWIAPRHVRGRAPARHAR